MEMENMGLEFNPMRSLIYVDCIKEQNRHKLKHWLYYHHVPESIAQFGPYVSKYAFYPALPVPPEGERFGGYKMQLTEHYWMVNPMCEELNVKTLKEFFPMDVLKWQGTIPEEVSEENMLDGDSARSTGGDNGMPPFIFAFLPISWQKDIKGNGRSMEDGPNYRWQFMIKYPDGVSLEEGDKWFFEKVIPFFEKAPEVNRILTSQVIQSVNGCPFQRTVEMWFDGPNEWYKVAVKEAAAIEKPVWATCNTFPYLKPKFEIASLFLTDIAESDNYTQYRGFIPMR